jgi:3-oxoacyl-[acyl-carrier protein] reductase
MADRWLNLSRNRAARKLGGMVGIPTPQVLERADGPLLERPLEGVTVSVSVSPKGAGPVCTKTLQGMGAECLESLPAEEEEIGGLVFDATEISDVSGLKALYEFFHPRVRSLRRCSRVVVLGTDWVPQAGVSMSAVRHALIGFTKSLAKELGRKGGTANLILVSPDAPEGLAAPLRYFMSNRSAFVSGQLLTVTAANDTGSWTQPLAGKTALVTGAVRGIGRATAGRLAEEGARVLLLDLPQDEEALKELAEELGGVAVPLDITGEEAVDTLLEVSGGTIDIVVHNAGITRDKTLGRMPEGFWDLTLSVNLGAVISVTEELLAKEAIPDGGRVVLVSSVAGIAGNVGQTNYAASKAGIVGVTRSLASQVGEQGITVNAVAPGFIETRLTDAIPFGIREVGRRLSNLNQGGLPTDIAEAITFLASPGAGSVQGNVLRVCGGNLLGA